MQLSFGFVAKRYFPSGLNDKAWTNESFDSEGNIVNKLNQTNTLVKKPKIIPKKCSKCGKEKKYSMFNRIYCNCKRYL